jgi:hypothetical protein
VQSNQKIIENRK